MAQTGQKRGESLFHLRFRQTRKSHQQSSFTLCCQVVKRQRTHQYILCIGAGRNRNPPFVAVRE